VTWMNGEISAGSLDAIDTRSNDEQVERFVIIRFWCMRYHDENCRIEKNLAAMVVLIAFISYAFSVARLVVG
jgi:hypothetical protein